MSRRAAIEPRLLSREQAAGYCGLSIPTFEGECPVNPVHIRSRVLYDRAALDRWLDSLSPAPANPGQGKWLERLDDADARQGD